MLKGCLLDLVRLAPSSFNMQNYGFVLVRDPELWAKASMSPGPEATDCLPARP
jgi:nitroreductase